MHRFELDTVSHTDSHPIALRSRVCVATDSCAALQRISCNFSAMLIKFVIAIRGISVSQMICHDSLTEYGCYFIHSLKFMKWTWVDQDSQKYMLY
jgi:hypothetical protein